MTTMDFNNKLISMEDRLERFALKSYLKPGRSKRSSYRRPI